MDCSVCLPGEIRLKELIELCKAYKCSLKKRNNLLSFVRLIERCPPYREVSTLKRGVRLIERWLPYREVSTLKRGVRLKERCPPYREVSTL